MPRLTILVLSLMLGGGSAVLVSCGGGDEPSGPGIPAADAEGMLGELERARAAFEAGDCEHVEEAANDILANAENLASNDPPLDPEIEEGLTRGAQQLAELAQTSSECEEQTTTTTDDEDKTTTTEEPTTTTPTTTAETTTTTTTEEPPPSDDGDDGGGGGQPTPAPAPPGGTPSPGGGGTGGVGDGE